MIKTSLFILAIAAFCTMGCKKGGSVSPGLFGKWELRRVYGGISYRDSTYKTGNGTVYQFNSNSTYKHFTKNQLDGQGVFHIRIGHELSANQLPDHLIFFDNATSGELFALSGTVVTIGTTVTDQIASDYEKISN